jgi:hypothetical protein
MMDAVWEPGEWGGDWGVCMATDFWFTCYLKHNRRERGAKWVFVRKAGSRRTSSEFKPAAIVLNLVDYHYA